MGGEVLHLLGRSACSLTHAVLSTGMRQWGTYLNTYTIITYKSHTIITCTMCAWEY